jgi:hypothetical protein
LDNVDLKIKLWTFIEDLPSEFEKSFFGFRYGVSWSLLWPQGAKFLGQS